MQNVLGYVNVKTYSEIYNTLWQKANVLIKHVNEFSKKHNDYTRDEMLKFKKLTSDMMKSQISVSESMLGEGMAKLAIGHSNITLGPQTRVSLGQARLSKSQSKTARTNSANKLMKY